MTRIRPVRPEDIDALYAISLATGFEGGDASHLYDDPALMGHIYSAPYAALCPELALVVEDDAGVAGFVVGTADTLGWQERLERDWWPALRRRYPDPAEFPAPERTPDQRRAFMIHHPEAPPVTVTDHYPAHLHMNLLPRLQGAGLGTRLFADWRRLAEAQRAGGVHVGVNRANARALGFWRKMGFRDLGYAEGRTLWMGRE
ncbi:GNAT family N-acetyltransferase [Salipiger abyssi]|uniref:Acetyltransferase (GNAT) family protein n=1 Tax=Salipiger abyssi TaxID=1250539 RepID=A0A1P8UV82_9RHOB|nr:GNAT family N-acetyltransferase [Salipiger abyssi]APZ53311.1 acetyltransferase (GNAT) family protein [Salipiger abyssi]